MIVRALGSFRVGMGSETYVVHVMKATTKMCVQRFLAVHRIGSKGSRPSSWDGGVSVAW